MKERFIVELLEVRFCGRIISESRRLASKMGTVLMTRKRKTLGKN
jgi:hypothetical protein